MLLRVMGSNSERTSEDVGSNGSAGAHNSLNSFVVNHQTPLSYSKSQRRGGLPRGIQTGSTGNLLTSTQQETQHHHRLSYDANNLRLMPRASSASQELPQRDWLQSLDRTDFSATAPSPSVASQTLSRPLTAPPGPGSADDIHTLSSGACIDSAELPVRKAISRKLSLGQRSASLRSRKESMDDTTTAGQEATEEGGSTGVPVFVMMPLDTVNADGIFRHASSRWFHQALESLASSGVHGIAIDVWWGAVERQPERYDWSGYCQVFELAKSMGLKIQAVLSFHACGGNVGDSAQIPLPKWVLQAGEQDPDIFFTDRLRESRRGQRNREYISFWADEAPRALHGRTPLECYTDFMRSFRGAFFEDIGDAIEEVVIGCGPCGELRYASYPEMNGWRFPGVGEFQCYDRRALASLAQAAKDAGHPEWGHTGPHDCGEYNSNPEETGFFCGWGGSWDTPYGRFFLEWYSKALVDHGERLLQAAATVFSFRLPKSSLKGRQGNAVVGRERGATGQSSGTASPDAVSPGSRGNGVKAESRAGDFEGPFGESSPNTSSASLPTAQGMSNTASGTSLDSSFPTDAGASTGQRPAFIDRANGSDNSLLGWPRLRPASFRDDGKSMSLASLATDESVQVGLQSTRSEDGEHRSARLPDKPSGKPVAITLKVAGVHWWYRTRAHAAELTAGYFNAGERDGYRDIIDLCAKYNATFTLTCVEMCDAQHPPEALCSPEGLLRQVKEAATEAGVEMGGENALPCFSPQHIDVAGLDRIAYNTQAWAPPLQEEAAKEEALYNRHLDPSGLEASAVLPPLPDAVKLGFLNDPRLARSGKLLQSHLPTLRGLTFLRLTPEMMSPSYQGAWLRFMRRMQSIGRRPN